MVKISNISKDVKDSYIDSAENELLDFFDKPQKDKYLEITKELNKPDISWAMRYHLSPRREMILSWYPFDNKSRILEIGAGCGAVTNTFLDKLGEVVCNELSPSRAKVIARRFRDSENLEIVVGNIEKYNPNHKFDYVTLIGVLEYAGTYSDEDSDNPYLKLLKTCRKLLSKDGHLLIAIENKLGLKYLSGAPEDHLGIPFVSIENYPQGKAIQTFTKTELKKMLKASGFANNDFYFPFPDYKLPTSVFSEDGLSLVKNMTKSSITQTVDLSHVFSSMYNETALGFSLYQENLLSEFSNSFLIDAY